jgi:NAD(P)-dependent dehydrogenase (short-subunit alcohol dehydrogenase family)
VSAVLVTGAAGDIGGAIAEELAAAGRDLVLADQAHGADALARRADACHSIGATVATVTFDVTDTRAVAQAITGLGPLAGVVNNAAYQGVFAPVERYPLDDARRVLQVNVLGVMAVLSVAARSMVAGGQGGSIVNVASMAGVSGAPNMSAYSASKAAVIGLTKAAAKDLAPAGIRVNAVSPGFIGPGKMWHTQISEQAALGSPYFGTDPDAVAREMIDMVPLRRYGSTHEVAAVVAFLLSDAASYVNGVNLEVSGGSV